MACSQLVKKTISQHRFIAVLCGCGSMASESWQSHISQFASHFGKPKAFARSAYGCPLLAAAQSLRAHAQSLHVAEARAEAEMKAAAALGKAANELTSKRPKRCGKWFVCHQDELSKIKYEEVCDIYAEFLMHHPNGGAATAGFVAVRLSDEQIEKQRDLIRISSYRWRDVKGVGPDLALEPMIPSNYLWFLEHIRERGQILCLAALKLVLSAPI